MTVEGKGWTVQNVKKDGDWKYKGCTIVPDIKAVDPDYLTNDIDANGVWSEWLGDLKNGGDSTSVANKLAYEGMFYNCTALTSFTADLSSLMEGEYMFNGCTALISFNSDISNLKEA